MGNVDRLRLDLNPYYPSSEYDQASYYANDSGQRTQDLLLSLYSSPVKLNPPISYM